MDKPDINFLPQTWEEIREQAVGFVQERFPQYTDTAPSDFGMMILEVLAKFVRMIYYRINFALNESFLSTATLRASLLKFADQLGYTPKLPAAASVDLTIEKQDQPRTATVPEGTEVQTTDGEVTFVTVEQLVMPPGQAVGSVSAIHAESHKGELLGVSTGEEFQEFQLMNSPLVKRADNYEVGLNVYVDGEEWIVVDSLFQHLGDEAVCEHRIDADQNSYLAFGDNKKGKLPREGAEITVDYYTGGGKEGLVGPRTLVELSGGENVADVYNEEPGTGGRGRLSKEELRDNIRSQVTTLERLVTKEDYRNLIIAEIPEVEQVSIEHPANNLVNVYVMASRGHPPSADLLDQVQNFIDSHAIETDHVIARKPEVVEVDVSASLILKEGYGANVLQESGSNNPNGKNILGELRDFINRWKFSDEIYINDVYEWFEGRIAVKETTVTKLNRRGEEGIKDLDTDLDEVFATGDITLSVVDE